MNKLTSELLLSEFNEHLFSSERPIKTLAEDELGRSDFAIAVAKVIIQWTGHDSLVLGVFGPWGSGKSSIKNMILDALSKLNANTITLEFNPWEWAGQEKVFEGFFGELSAKLGKADTSKDAAKTAKIVRMYGAMLSAASSITGRFRWFLVGLLAIAGLIGLAPLLQAPRPFTIFWFLEMLVLIVALALAASGQVTNKIADYFDAKAQATRKSVAELKLELHDLLKGLKTNVLVVVDDVDRLTPEGVRIVFQLVKVNADFPNLVYLLLFQRDTIETTLSRMGDVNGAEFLEKIVQVGFDIPKLSAKKLEESLESTISEIVQGTSADPKFDSQRWAKLFVSAIRPYFRSLRDIKRFTDTLSFHCELYKSGNAFDANPVDLIALEVLRQFEAPLYAKLYGARALLTGVPREPFAPYTGEAKKAAEALLDKVNRLNEAREILGGVFPPFARALVGPEDAEGSSGPPHNAAFRSEWLRDLRPCHPDMFERYFRFSLSAEDLSESQLASVLSAMENRISFAGKLRELSERGLLGAVVAALGARSQLLPIENALT
ncbi:MAG: P-loop NTPase fold protein, partial [Candidatus Acidiferrales bacterium]